MQQLRRHLSEARTKLETADHLLYVTYPSIKDVKMLYGVAETVSFALQKTMKALVHYDQMYKRVPLVPGDFRSEFEIFKHKCLVRYRLNPQYVSLIVELHRLVEFRKKSPMEFVRRDKFVICTENYKMKMINSHKVKGYLQLSKAFMNDVSRITKC